jgi:hypothetical protein
LRDLPRREAVCLRERDDRLGTLPPARRACDNPIAMACFLLVTFLPEPPLRSVPRLRSFIAFLTFVDAFLPYLAMSHSLIQRVWTRLSTWQRCIRGSGQRLSVRRQRAL